MSVPEFLASSFHYILVAGVADVATIITSFRDEVLNQLSTPWSEPVAGTFKSPVDSNGRWFDVALSSIAADKLNCKVRNWLGTTIMEKRCQIDIAGTQVRIATGNRHFAILSDRATPEQVCGGFMDISPESQIAHTDVIWATGHRDLANAESKQFMQYVANLGGDNLWTVFPYESSGNYPAAQSLAGAYLFAPVEHDATGAAHARTGRRYQILYGPSAIPNASDVTVPIDTGVTAVFMGMGMTHNGGAPYRFFVRKA